MAKNPATLCARALSDRRRELEDLRETHRWIVGQAQAAGATQDEAADAQRACNEAIENAEQSVRMALALLAKAGRS